MPRRKCTRKQLAALKRGREIAHKRSKKRTMFWIGKRPPLPSSKGFPTGTLRPSTH